MRSDAEAKGEMLATLVVSTVLLLLSGNAAAQAPTEDVEVDPLTCWWRTSAGSVRVGEPLTVVLTCAVVETASTRVVPDQSRLEASVVQLPPFEVVGGTRAEDLKTVGQRFLQYEYTLRLIAEEAFARDVAIPALAVSYRIETQMGQGGASQGREQTYELPALPIRVTSLVPNESSDIREAAPTTLAEIENRGFRAGALRVGAMALFALGGLVLLTGLVRTARSRRVETESRRTLGEAAILRGAEQALVDVQRRRRQGGWTPDLLSRALAALRIVGSLASGRSVSQRVLPRGAVPVEGELVMGGRFGRGPAALSGSATPLSLSDWNTNGRGDAAPLQTSLASNARRGWAVAPRTNSLAPADKSLLDAIADGLSRLDGARYGRESIADPDVETALESGAQLARRLAAQHGWLAMRQAAVVRALDRMRPGTWAS